MLNHLVGNMLTSNQNFKKQVRMKEDVIVSSQGANMAPKGEFLEKFNWSLVDFIFNKKVGLCCKGNLQNQRRNTFGKTSYERYIDSPLNDEEWLCWLKGELRPQGVNTLEILYNFVLLNEKEILCLTRGGIPPKRGNAMDFKTKSLLNILLK